MKKEKSGNPVSKFPLKQKPSIGRLSEKENAISASPRLSDKNRFPKKTLQDIFTLSALA
jgi:hypothetical protein